jgi:hypothetical protein
VRLLLPEKRLVLFRGESLLPVCAFRTALALSGPGINRDFLPSSRGIRITKLPRERTDGGDSMHDLQKWLFSRRAVIRGVGLLVATACSPTARAPTPSIVASGGISGGRLSAAKQMIDLGRVPFERRVDGVFDLFNDGATTVRLTGPPRVAMLEGC